MVWTLLHVFQATLALIHEITSDSLPSSTASFLFNPIRRSVSISDENWAKPPQFRFFNEFIEPLPGVLNDLFPVSTINDPIVETTNGLLRGTIKESRDGRKYAAFLGIPYAQNPVSKLRFEPPVKLTSKWKGIRNAKTYSSPCFHLDTFVSGRVKGTEKCLYANIYSPSIDSSNLLPVMIYIHGGGYNTGSGDFYQGKYFMDFDVILVVFNYRLAALGFLNTQDGIIRGNMALKDQIMLLHWVQENIKNFGGDANRVTLFGESVGGAMTQFLILDDPILPLSNGLFQKAIALSSSPFSPWAFSKNLSSSESAKRLARSTGCPTNISSLMVQCLKEVPLWQLAKGYTAMMSSIGSSSDFFAPSIDYFENIPSDDTVIKISPEEKLRQKELKKIPLMMGVNSMEGLMHVSRILADKNVRDNFDKNWDKWIPILFGYNSANTTLSQMIKRSYFTDGIVDLYKKEHIKMLGVLMSDGLFFYPVHKFAKLYYKHSPLYLYYNTYQNRFSVFDILTKVPALTGNEIYGTQELSLGTGFFADLLKYRLTNERPSNLGSSHGDSVLLLFNLRGVPGIGKLSMDYEMSKMFVKTLVDFASSKEPVTFQGIPWPVVQNSSYMPFMQVDLFGQVIGEPFIERMKLWETIQQQSD